MKKLSSLLVLPLIALTAACSNDTVNTPDAPDTPDAEKTPTPYTIIPVSGNTRGNVETNNSFSFNLFNKLAEESAGEDAGISTYSVFSVLSMMANGDNSGTRDEILDVLGFETGAAGLESLNEFNRIMAEYLPKVDNTTGIAIANSIWAKEGTRINTLFADRLATDYGSALFTADLGSEDGKNRLNSWMEENTNRLIKNFLTAPIPGVTLGIANAFYFKGNWRFGFDSDLTAPADFTCSDGCVSKVNFMHLSTSTSYAKTDKAELIELPYGNGNFSMILMLGNKGDKTALTYEDYTAALQAVVHAEVTLSLPRFDKSCGFNILDALSALGIEKAMSDDYGFNGIIENDKVKLNFFRQATRIITDESGSEAGAGSLAGFDIMANPDMKFNEVSIDFNRPFTYIIRERSTGTILFIGSVNRL